MSNVKLTMFVFSLADHARRSDKVFGRRRPLLSGSLLFASHVRQADNVFGRRRPLLSGSLVFATNRSIAEIDSATRPAVRPPERSDHLTKK